MADIGFCIDDKEGAIPIGEYLQLFQINPTDYEVIGEKIKISIQRSKPVALHEVKDKGSYTVCQDNGNIVVATRYGCCKYGIVFKVDEWAGEEILLQINSEISKESFNLNQLLSMTGIHSAFLSRDAITVHASYIETQKGAILFTAPSQTGKSTQAELWKRYTGAEIINGDRALVRKQDERWFAYGISVCGSSEICKNKKVPIRSIVVLEQGKENVIQDMSRGEKYRALLLASAVYNWDADQLEKVTEIIMQLMEEVRIIKLVCRPDEDAVRTLQAYLREVEENDS